MAKVGKHEIYFSKHQGTTVSIEKIPSIVGSKINPDGSGVQFGYKVSTVTQIIYI